MADGATLVVARAIGAWGLPLRGGGSPGTDSAPTAVPSRRRTTRGQWSMAHTALHRLCSTPPPHPVYRERENRPLGLWDGMFVCRAAANVWAWAEANGAGMGGLTGRVLSLYGGDYPQRLARNRRAGDVREPKGLPIAKASKEAWERTQSRERCPYAVCAARHSLGQRPASARAREHRLCGANALGRALRLVVRTCESRRCQCVERRILGTRRPT